MQQGRLVVVTGAGGGIGAKIVDRFLANGDKVIGLGRSEASLDKLKSGQRPDAQLWTQRVDITNSSEVLDFAEHLRMTRGGIDVLVNCAGCYPIVPFEQMTVAQWQEVIGINLTGTFQMTHTLLPSMKDRGWGRIINIGSASVFEGVPGQTHYVSEKAGLVGFTRSLAMEIGHYGITVNLVAPGLTLTDPVLESMSRKLIDEQQEVRALKRDESAGGLAGPVFLLASPDADFVTGQLLVGDGGKVKH